MKILKVLILGLMLNLSCLGQNKTQDLKLSDFKFESIFGFLNADSSNMFCLLGQGFLRTPRSNNSDSIIRSWFSNHKDAGVIPVSGFEQTIKYDITIKTTYCWIVDGADTLNIYLVNQGCFPGVTMQRPKTWKEMKKSEKRFYRNTEIINVQVYISDNEYIQFMNKIIAAERYAAGNKLGIWDSRFKE